MIKKIYTMIQNKKQLSVNIFSESPLKTSLYEELQTNGWCNVISDKPDKLVRLITITQKK